MRIPIDRQSTEPLYRQIKEYFRQGILSGGLLPESRLPSSRQLARARRNARVALRARARAD